MAKYSEMAKIKYLKNPHPGEILQEEFLHPLQLSQKELADAIDISTYKIHSIIHARTKITADLDLRLSKYFGLSEGYWLRLQNAYDMIEAKQVSSESIAMIKPCIKIIDHRLNT